MSLLAESPAISARLGFEGQKRTLSAPQRLSSFVNPIDLSVCPRLQSGPGSGGATDQPVSLRSGRSPRAVNLPRSLFRKTKQSLRSHLKTPREYKFRRQSELAAFCSKSSAHFRLRCATDVPLTRPLSVSRRYLPPGG